MFFSFVIHKSLKALKISLYLKSEDRRLGSENTEVTEPNEDAKATKWARWKCFHYKLIMLINN